MRLGIRLVCGVLALLCLLPKARAEQPPVEETDENGQIVYHIPEDWTALDVMNYFLDAYDLDEDNFAMSFLCPGTGERCGFNETGYMLAASTYKLPLNMYYYEQEAAGVYSENTYIGGMSLANAHIQSIVYSMNEISHAMIYNLGSFYNYKQLMLEHYGDLPEEEVDPRYWQNNYYCTKFMLNTLRYLYDHQEVFEQLIGYMKQAMPGEYLQKYAGSVEVAHKYGFFENCSHDMGIVYTEQPFLIAVYTQSYYAHGGGIELVARINAAMIAYQQQRTALDRAAAARAEEESRAAEEAAAAAAAEAEAASRAAEEASVAAEEASRAAEESRRIAESEQAAAEEASRQAALRAEAEQRAQSRRTVLYILAPAVLVTGLVLAFVLFRKKK